MNLLHANDRPGAYPASFYAATATSLAPFPTLTGAQSADICIVGGGYTGLSAALHAAQAGLSVILLEAHRVGFGASGRNGGQVGSGQRLDQKALERIAGDVRARAFWDMGEDAKALVRAMIADHAMPVPFRPGVAHACHTEAEVRADHANAAHLSARYGYTAVETLDRAGMRRLIGSDSFAGGSLDRGAGHIHPLDFALGLARAAAGAGADLRERSEVIRIDPGPRPVIHTAEGQVTCTHLLLAANGYLGALNADVAARVMPINNYMIATEPLGGVARDILSEPVAVADSKFIVNYWRLSDDNRLLFGGGETYGYRFPDIERIVRKPMAAIYPQLADVRIDHAWGGTLAITLSRMPAFLRPTPNILSASGYSGHGVALATLAGKMMALAAQGQAAGFDLMASLPQRRFPGGAALRHPLLVAAMTWYGLRDRLGI